MTGSDTTPRLSADTTSQVVEWGPLLLAGGGLGLFAFIGDEMPGVAGVVILTLTSSGFAWGGAALLAGYMAARRRVYRTAAPISAAVVLVGATTVYYGLILAHGRRWRLGVLEDGGSTTLVGLASVGRAAAFWLAASVVAGIILGHLGALIRRGTRIPATIAAGVALGLFAGEGLAFFLIFRGWGALDAFFLGRVLSAATSVLLATAGLPLLLAHRQAAKSWPLFATTALASCAAGALLWHLLSAITTAI